MVKIKISSTPYAKKLSKWDNSLKTFIVKKLIGLEGLKDVEDEKCLTNDFIVHCRNKECTYWSNNQRSFGDYLGHGATSFKS